MAGVSIRSLSKEYVQDDKHVLAVSNVNLEIADGEFVCEIGRAHV